MVAGAALLLGGVNPAMASAQDDPAPTDAEQELADRFAPVMMLKAQEEPCDTEGEPYGPTAVDIVLDNPEVVLRQVGNADPVVMVAPGASDLFGLESGSGDSFVLDPAMFEHHVSCRCERGWCGRASMFDAGTRSTGGLL